MAEVTVRNVVKRYGTVQVMHGVSVDIEDGQFVVLVGPSGCGKSTLLRMIAGLEMISDGEISIGGRVVNDVHAQGPRHRHGVPVLRALPAQDRRREHGLRAQDQGRAEGRDRGQGRAAPPTILDLGHLLDRYPKQLSGGQRQRVAMGRAIVRDPAGLPLRRAALQPRRQAPRRHARRDQGAAPAARRPRSSTSPTTRSRR